MTCHYCMQIATCEHDPAAPTPQGECSCTAREITITYLTPERFAASPQVGIIVRQDWPSLAAWLTTPTDGTAKPDAGAWCPCALVGGVVAGGRGTFDLLAADVDHCGPDGYARTCAALAPYAGAVATTYSATADDTRHRVALVCDRTLAVDEYPIAWRQLARVLARAGIVIDHKCKNTNRLYFAPVVRAGGVFAARVLTGSPLPVDRMLASGRATEAREVAAAAARRAQAPQRATGTGTGYAHAALSKAAENVATAGQGDRNATLNREAYALARLPELTDAQIWDALGEAAARAGLARTETTKTIASALRARRQRA